MCYLLRLLLFFIHRVSLVIYPSSFVYKLFVLFIANWYSMLWIWPTIVLFSRMAMPCYIATDSERSSFSTSLRAFNIVTILFLFLLFLYGRSGLIMVLICISLISSEDEHLLSFFAICILYDEMFLYVFCLFSNQIFVTVEFGVLYRYKL